MMEDFHVGMAGFGSDSEAGSRFKFAILVDVQSSRLKAGLPTML